MTIQAKYDRYQPVDSKFQLEKNKEPELDAMKIWLNIDGNDYRDAKQQLERTMRNAKEVFWKVW